MRIAIFPGARPGNPIDRSRAPTGTVRVGPGLARPKVTPTQAKPDQIPITMKHLIAIAWSAANLVAFPLQAGVLAGPLTNAANSHLYYLLGTSSWTLAEAEATTLGGHLVTINDAAEQQWIVNHFLTLAGSHPIWIGLSDRDIEGTFQWVNGETSEFRNWNTGAPSASVADRDFAYLLPSTHARAGRWDNEAEVQAPDFFAIVEAIPAVATEMAISTAIEIAWPTRNTNSYQVQWCSPINTNVWFNLGPLLHGTGSTNYYFDSTRSAAERFYRVVATRWPTISASSYANYKDIGLTPHTLPEGNNSVRAYGDFTGDGRLDLFRAVLTYSTASPPSKATPSRFEFYTGLANGRYARNTVLLPRPAGGVHPRKAIVADFNGDGRPDIFVACHGYDAEPFPGERNKVVLSQPDGRYEVSDASSEVEFHHGASAADLNGDGKADVVVANNSDAGPACVFINDGTGHFTRESPNRLPASLRGGLYFSVELVDVDQDGWLDLLIGGHEFQGSGTCLFLNPGSNDFTSATRLELPRVPNEGVVLDFVVTGSGDSRAIWVLRTSGGDGTFYESRVVQRVAYPSLTSQIVLYQRPREWIPWLIPATVNRSLVVTSDNGADGVSIPQ